MNTCTLSFRPIFGAASVPFATWVLAQPKGLRKSMMLAAWLQLVCEFDYLVFFCWGYLCTLWYILVAAALCNS